jgi:hypothetical protein
MASGVEDLASYELTLPDQHPRFTATMFAAAIERLYLPQTGHLARREERAAKPVLKSSTINGLETCHPIDTAPPVREKMLLPHD